jgi:acyl-[acyl-carrier-protein] desaturase
MTHMGQGFTNAYADHTAIHGIAYVSFQELATRVSHRNTGRISGDPICDQLLARIALDENLHMLFYRNVLAASLEIAPNETMRAIADVVTTFQMPGHTIENFARKSVQIAMAGIYDLRLHHDEVVMQVLRAVKALDLETLTDDGQQARDQLVAFLGELDRQATRFEDRREKIRSRKHEHDAEAAATMKE